MELALPRSESAPAGAGRSSSLRGLASPVVMSLLRMGTAPSGEGRLPFSIMFSFVSCSSVPLMFSFVSCGLDPLMGRLFSCNWKTVFRGEFVVGGSSWVVVLPILLVVVGGFAPACGITFPRTPSGERIVGITFPRTLPGKCCESLVLSLVGIGIVSAHCSSLLSACSHFRQLFSAFSCSCLEKSPEKFASVLCCFG